MPLRPDLKPEMVTRYLETIESLFQNMIVSYQGDIPAGFPCHAGNRRRTAEYGPIWDSSPRRSGMISGSVDNSDLCRGTPLSLWNAAAVPGFSKLVSSLI